MYPIRSSLELSSHLDANMNFNTAITNTPIPTPKLSMHDQFIPSKPAVSVVVPPFQSYLQRAGEGDQEAMEHLIELHTSGRGGAKQDIVELCRWMHCYLQVDRLTGRRPRNPISTRCYLYAYGKFLLGSTTNSSFPDSQRRLPPSLIDPRKGSLLLERAAHEFNCERSIKILGSELHMTGLYHPEVPQNFEKGLYWLARGVRNGNGKAAFDLAMAFNMGVIAPTNREVEKKWFEIGARLGCTEARDGLAQLRKAPVRTQSEARKLLRHLGKEKNITNYLTTDRTTRCSNPGCDMVEQEGERFSLCESCKQVKYCSRECQSAHWREGGHKKRCSVLKYGKEQMKEANRNIALPFANICFNPACAKPQPKGVVFSICGSCKVARYCSRSCQVIHYKNGHKGPCSTICTYIKEGDKILGELADT